MGLDTTAYERATIYTGTPVEPYSDEWYDLGLVKAWSYDVFEEHALAGLVKDANYLTSGRTSSTHSGYCGHSVFRDLLAEIAGVSGFRIHDDMVYPSDAPFYELIWFADNEGVLGPIACAALAQDFDDHEVRAEEQLDGRMLHLYRAWSVSVHLAADTGLIWFH